MASLRQRSRLHLSTKHLLKKFWKFHHSLSLVSHLLSLFPTCLQVLILSAAIVTVEKAAAAKIHLECHYNGLLTKPYSPRSIRRRELEAELYTDASKTAVEKDEKRRAWLQLESNHLRESRNMKVRGYRALKGMDHVTSNYEPLKILGKGSFGVVRLVREKQELEYVNSILFRMK